MKRGLFFFLFFQVYISIIHASTIAWDGEGVDGLWSTPANWVGDILPAPSDDVLLDNSFMTGNYTVTLPPGAVSVSVQSLTISPSASTIITLVLPASNTADPGLHVSGPGDALVLNSGSIVRNASGASAGSGLLVAGSFRISNGARYIHNTSRGNAAIVSQLSTIPGTETGIFEYDVPAASYTISLSNRNYGTLRLSSLTRGGLVSYVGSGANPLHIRGDLEISSGVNFNLGMSADFNLNGSFRQDSSSVFDMQTGNAPNLIKIRGDILSAGLITESGNGLPVMELNGTINQDLSIAGSFQNSITLRINNPAGVNLISPVILPYQLDLVAGRIRTDVVNMLVIADNATCTGGSPASFVEGPMSKTGDEDFSFPVGKGQIYAPLGLTGVAGASVSDQFVAEYIRSNPQTIYGTVYQAGTPPFSIDHISYVEYWKLSSNTGNSVSKNVTLQVNCASFCRNFNTLFVAGFNHTISQWSSLGKSGSTSSSPVSCTGYETGTITSGIIDEFGAFALATWETFVENPLPVTLVSFHAARLNERTASVEWILGGEGDRMMEFELQRSGADHRFTKIALVKGVEGARRYTMNDNHLQPGINYYRLKMIGSNGVASYSKIVSILTENNKLVSLSLAPTVVSSTTVLSVVCLRESDIDIRVVDMLGRTVRRRNDRVQAGMNRISWFLDDLPAGVYHLYCITKDGSSDIVRFIKRSPL